MKVTAYLSGDLSPMAFYNFFSSIPADARIDIEPDGEICVTWVVGELK